MRNKKNQYQVISEGDIVELKGVGIVEHHYPLFSDYFRIKLGNDTIKAHRDMLYKVKSKVIKNDNVNVKTGC